MPDHADDEGRHFPDRWVRVMADYSADGVWESSGVMGDIDQLPIGDGLRERIMAWQARYDREAQADGFDVEAFAREGLDIAKAVKAELPDWTVVYFDEAKALGNLPRAAYEYEIAA